MAKTRIPARQFTPSDLLSSRSNAPEVLEGDQTDKKTVLLFYREPQRDRFFRGDRHVRRVLRPLYNHVRRDQSVSGFYIWYINLIKALRSCGCRVILNDRHTARTNPKHPVGLVGYPELLEDWNLPNPVVLGPGMFDHPRIRTRLFDDSRFRLYIVTCRWMYDMFYPYYGDHCVMWHAGIDTEEWPDTSNNMKTIDLLVYDKIRWQRDHYDVALLQPIYHELARRGLSMHVLLYGRHSREMYRNLLQKSRAMLFLCEHETQGLAYQEALASNVPVLAWDPGSWLDPRRPLYDPNPVPATSVPYFSSECGERFRDLNDFHDSLDRFLDRLRSYEPRRFVHRELSIESSGTRYFHHYRSVAGADLAF